MNNKISALQAGTVMIGGLYVNRLAFGAMRLTGPGIWGEPADREVAKDVLRRAVELDVNFIDTADAYGPEVSERLIQEALYPYDGIMVATKGGMVRRGPGQWAPDCSPKHLRDACEASLRRLKIDRIELYQLHRVDPAVPFEESFRTLLDLQKEGKIRYIGLSNIEPEHFEAALKMGQFVSVQNNYNVLNREHEDVLHLCEANEVAFIPYFPIGGNREQGIDASLLSSIGAAHQATARQIGLAWLLEHSSMMLPIPGTSSIAHLEENIAAASIQLSEAERRQLDELAVTQ